MNKIISTASLALSLLAISFSAEANVIIFDGASTAGKAGIPGTAETASGTYTGNPDVWGDVLNFSDFDVRGGISVGDNLNEGLFSRGDIRMTAVDQDKHPVNGGLGVCSEDSECAGDSDSFTSSNPDGNSDEILFFDFDNWVSLETVWFNGDHSEKVDYGNNRYDKQKFNIYYSLDGDSYTNVFANHQLPKRKDYLTLDAGSYRFWAVAASGLGKHDGYVEAIRYTTVPEPSIWALMGLGLLGLGFAQRKRSA